MISSESQRQAYVSTLKTEADRLSHLVENVLEYAQLERGKGGGKKERVAITALLDRVVPRLSERASLAKLELIVQVSGEEERFSQTELLTDPTALEQILFNLVDNACKYGRSETRPEILLKVSAGETEQAEFVVEDFGGGISRQQQRSLFQPFSKSAEEAAVSAPGVGLGLALCKRMAATLGGSLRLAATSAKGTVFVLAVPLAQAPR